MSEYKRFQVTETKKGKVTAAEKRSVRGKYKNDNSKQVIFEADSFPELYTILEEEFGKFSFHKRNGEIVIRFGGDNVEDKIEIKKE